MKVDEIWISDLNEIQTEFLEHLKNIFCLTEDNRAFSNLGLSNSLASMKNFVFRQLAP